MADNTKIEWAEATWNPIVGCDKVSPGCKNCYAIRDAHRMAGNPNKKISTIYSGLTEVKNGAPNWTGVVRFIEDRLDQPLRWKRPRMIFVNSQSDLFHESVSFEVIDKIFAVMALCPQHIFQVLTKRPARALEYFAGTKHAERWERVRTAAALTTRKMQPEWDWPLENVWFGVSAENQETYDERSELLKQIPAAVKWFSMEPLLGEIKADYMGDWCVVGGESGPNARPMNPDWARKLRDQCVSAGVPFFFKQWGAYLPDTQNKAMNLTDEFRQSDYSGAINVGKKAAGRLLDGREWNEFPKTNGAQNNA